jgi:hypothetical protein
MSWITVVPLLFTLPWLDVSEWLMVRLEARDPPPVKPPPAEMLVDVEALAFNCV